MKVKFNDEEQPAEEPKEEPSEEPEGEKKPEEGSGDEDKGDEE